MAKKLSLLLGAAAAVACAVPAFASAAPAVTDGGKLLAVPKLLQATNTTAVTVQTSFGVTSCSSWTFTATLTTNTGNTFRGTGSGTSSASGCIKGGKPITITDITLKEFHSATVGSGTMSLTFVDDASIVCHFEAPNMPFTYTSGGDVIQVTNGDLKGSPAACEPGTFNGAFTVETDGGGSVVLD